MFGDSKRKILACPYKLSFQALLKHGTNEYFEFKKFKVLIDFAHNASGYKGIEEYLQSVDATKRLECWYW
jgi:hypothetical protein